MKMTKEDIQNIQKLLDEQVEGHKENELTQDEAEDVIFHEDVVEQYIREKYELDHNEVNLEDEIEDFNNLRDMQHAAIDKMVKE